MKIKKIVAVILCGVMAVMLLSSLDITDEASAAESFAITSPADNRLVGAGHFDIKWSSATKGTVKNYKVYIDNQLVATTSETSYEYYTTTVKMYSAYVTAEYSDGTSQSTENINFGVTKKGLCANETMARNLDPVQMNMGWYYNWAANPHTYDNFDKIEYVPMIWGTANEGSIPSVASAGYKHLLAYNEPDMGNDIGGSNIDVNTAIANWSKFLGNDYYLGTPAPGLCPAWDNGTWFRTFMNGIDHSTVDFIALHCYYGQYAGKEAAETFLTEVVDGTYEMYKKPIWITEFAVSGWSYNDTESIEKIKEFMKAVIDGLNERDYVERYAWFSFGATDTSNGASAIYNVDTGELTDLGEVYVSYGNPQGYVTPAPDVKNYTVTSETRSALLDGSVSINGVVYEDFLNKSGVTVNASSTINSDSSADKAIDNDIGTRWESVWQDDTSFTIDLGQVINIKQMNIIWETASAKQYTIEVSTDGQSYTSIAKQSSGASYDYRNDTILLNEMVSGRYIKINCVSRSTEYGYSIRDIAVYGQEYMEETTTESETTVSGSTIATSDSVKIEGYQISSNLGGSRVIASVEPEINGKSVSKWGIVYALTDIEGTTYDVEDEDIYVGSENDYVKAYESQEAGTIDGVMGDSQTATYYVRTMLFSSFTKKEFTTKYKVRAYALLEDGSYVYSNASSYSIYNISNVLYRNKLMNNFSSHDYLYNNILTVVDPAYAEVDYDWSKCVVQ